MGRQGTARREGSLNSSEPQMEQPLLDQGAAPALPLDAKTAPSLPLWWLVFISLYYVPIMLSWQLLGAIMLPKAVHQVEMHR